MQALLLLPMIKTDVLYVWLPHIVLLVKLSQFHLGIALLLGILTRERTP